MTASRRRTLGFVATILAVVVVFLVIGVIASGGTPDVTRERVQHDLNISFANQWRLQQRILGKPAPAGFTATTECHHSPQGSPDRGPGTWHCSLEGRLPSLKKPLPFDYIALVDGTSCYSALDSDLPPTIRNRGGKEVANPLAAFDSCFNVYDDRTS
jgi:hypothetical protein